MRVKQYLTITVALTMIFAGSVIMVQAMGEKVGMDNPISTKSGAETSPDQSNVHPNRTAATNITGPSGNAPGRTDINSDLAGNMNRSPAAQEAQDMELKAKNTDPVPTGQTAAASTSTQVGADTANSGQGKTGSGGAGSSAGTAR